MDYYLLRSTFDQDIIIEDILEVVWAERYSQLGDATFKLPATKENLSLYPRGIKIGRAGSKEAIIIDKRHIKDGILTLTGKNLLNVVSKRSKFPGDEVLEEVFISEEFSMASDQFASVVFGESVREAGGGGGNPDPESAFIIDQLMPNPALGDPTWVGPVIPVSIPAGQDYLTPLLAAADLANMGITININQAEAGYYELYYNAYFGTDRSDTIVFSEDNGDISGVEVVESDENVAGSVFVYIPDYVGVHPWYLSVDIDGVVNTGAITDVLGFNLSSIVIPMTEITEDDYVDDTSTILRMKARALAELTARRPVTLADGEISPTAEYQFETDYFLGDVVTLKASSGITSTARITEYIWTSDATGDHEYPTIELID